MVNKPDLQWGLNIFDYNCTYTALILSSMKIHNSWHNRVCTSNKNGNVIDLLLMRCKSVEKCVKFF